MREQVEAVQRMQDGWQWADDEAPRYQLAPIGEGGYIDARPVKELHR